MEVMEAAPESYAASLPHTTRSSPVSTVPLLYLKEGGLETLLKTRLTRMMLMPDIRSAKERQRQVPAEHTYILIGARPIVVPHPPRLGNWVGTRPYGISPVQSHH